jgi:hypothetical protein
MDHAQNAINRRKKRLADDQDFADIVAGEKEFDGGEIAE